MNFNFNRPLMPCFFLLSICFILSSFGTDKKMIPLEGEWRFKMDHLDKGVEEKWYSTVLPETIKLPGSMAENGKGDEVTLKTQWTGSIYDSSWYFNPKMEKYRQPGNLKFPFWLTPSKYYVGPAWYQKEVNIPSDWKDQRVVLFLERPHIETRIWVDNKEIAMQNSLCVPHEYDLTKALSPGKHTISIRIDNRTKEIKVGQDSHSITDHTQGNWNGIVGKISLNARPKLWLEDVQVYPNLQEKRVKVKLIIKNQLNGSVSGKITLAAKSFNTSISQDVKALTKDFKSNGIDSVFEIDYPMGDKILTWDEFDPALYRLTVTISYLNGQKDERNVQFGMRDFKVNGTRFEINGRPIFLRGTVNNCEFPLTGYPSMDVASWERIFRIAKSHGLNHMRFHSYCPPEAAFIAADKIGFYLQPEGPSWANHGSSLGDGKPIDQYIYDETNRIAKYYGNYASFCMLAYGNEPKGARQAEYLGKFVNYWRAKDKRRQYTGASVAMSWPLVPENDFMVKSGPRGLGWNNQPESNSDYRVKIEKFSVPYVTHEMGQWCAFPDFKEIKKYTGAFRAKNFELFEEDLKDKKMGDQAEQFLLASGKLQALCYKAEIETALRTPGLAGFQLLALDDYPGQGTAIVGVLNAFWDEKGYISAKEFNRFCSPTVPLARMPKFVYTNNETFEVPIEIYHFGKSPIENAKVVWKITDVKGKEFAKGVFDAKTLPIGNCFPAGNIKVPLSDVLSASKLNLEVTIENTSYKNDWNFWVYPSLLPEIKSDEVYFSDKFDEKVEEKLMKGGKVLLHIPGKVEKGKEIVMYFTPVFWNTSWFQMKPPHILGIYCDPNHPAFEYFPTEFHSNLQWWEILNRAQVMRLDDFPTELKPIVQPIDTWFLNRKLGLILEAKVGNGKLIICSANLISEPQKRPVARQLLYSLNQYMLSDKFAPKTSVDIIAIKSLFDKNQKDIHNTYTKDSPDELKPKIGN